MDSAKTDKKAKDAAQEVRQRPHSLIRALWTDNSSHRGSALAELERQRFGAQIGPPTRRFLSWPERQRLVDAPGAPLWPMLVALGMLCVVSMSLTTPDNEIELMRIIQERIEAPFVPHEAEILSERPPVRVKEPDVDAEDESNVLLLQKKREYISKDEGDKQVDWVERRVALGEIMLKGEDIERFLSQAPPELVDLMESIMRHERDLMRQSHGQHKLAILLQHDLAAVAKLMLLCRILAATGNIDGEQAILLRKLLGHVTKRFGNEWPKALGLTRYVANVRERNLYLRLVSLVASTARATVHYILTEPKHGGEPKFEGSPSHKRVRERLLWKMTTGRLEIDRLLEQAKLSREIIDAFKVD